MKTTLNILVTGCAGFIGMHTAKKLASIGHTIFGIDSLNDYYDIQLKLDRLHYLGIKSTADFSNNFVKGIKGFSFKKVDISDKSLFDKLFIEHNIDCIIHLGAQAGVRYSIENPISYVDNNLIAFFNVLEACRQFKIKHLMFASSSSVYGNTQDVPFSENQRTDEPVSFYAATKKCNEVMAHSYSSLYNIQTIGLRFFTVYGPWGRPDMAPYIFTKAAFDNKPIKVFNQGKQNRDFTYIDDIVEGIRIIIENRMKLNLYEILNIGKGKPDELMNFIQLIERFTKKEIHKIYTEAQLGDVATTFADTSKLKSLGYNPSTNLEEGIAKFVVWYKEYHQF